jgi:hypothetical protein
LSRDPRRRISQQQLLYQFNYARAVRIGSDRICHALQLRRCVLDGGPYFARGDQCEIVFRIANTDGVVLAKAELL